MEQEPKKIAQLRSDALDVFLAVQDQPGDQRAEQNLAAFVSSGPEAKRAYDQVAAVWQTAQYKRRRRTARRRRVWAAAAAILLAVGVSATLQPSWISGADHVAGLAPAQIALSAGTNVMLDAGSSLSHETAAEGELVTLLQGAVFFDVAKRESPLAIKAGPLRISILGTAFDVALIDGNAHVSVAEGRVEVAWPNGTEILGEGDRLRLARGSGDAVKDKVATNQIALWRKDNLLADNQPFAEFAEALDRRIAGPVIITSSALGAKRLTGAFAMSDPVKALELAARAVGGRVQSYPWLTIVLAN
ncbi:MAG: FecR domain-containing protein [Pseudomonadota bacterium]